MLKHICAVVLTHMHPPPFLNRVTVPHIVTTDVPTTSWDAHYIDTGKFANTEASIGRHIQLAMQQAFATFEWCNVVAVLEDDVLISPDYFDAVSASYAWMMTTNKSCFTCINDLGYKNWGNWRANVLKPVTHSIGIGFAMTKKVFSELVWGVRLWDEFLRTTADLTCLVPEISRCKHIAMNGRTHGIGYETNRLDKLAFNTIPSHTFLIANAPLTPYANAPPCSVPTTLQNKNKGNTWRGSYNGLVVATHGLLCRLPPKHHSPPTLTYTWVQAPQATACTRACSNKGMLCSKGGFEESTSEHLRIAQSMNVCTAYGAEDGAELPAVVAGEKMCLFQVFAKEPSTCDAFHAKTQRLCPCFRPSKHNIVDYM